MNILNLFVIIPVLTVFAIVFTKDFKGARVAAATGMSLQLITSVILVMSYFAQRKAGMTGEFLFLSDVSWFKTLNIHYTVGVDSIAVWMLLLA